MKQEHGGTSACPFPAYAVNTHRAHSAVSSWVCQLVWSSKLPLYARKKLIRLYAVMVEHESSSTRSKARNWHELFHKEQSSSTHAIREICCDKWRHEFVLVVNRYVECNHQVSQRMHGQTLINPVPTLECPRKPNQIQGFIRHAQRKACKAPLRKFSSTNLTLPKGQKIKYIFIQLLDHTSGDARAISMCFKRIVWK